MLAPLFSGALITEYPPLAGVTRSSFPERNRIISGMSMGVLVVEAGERSGSLITARKANEQGRDVFAIPGSVLNSAYTGVNRLIRDGASAVTCAEDILGGYKMMYPDRLNLNAKVPEMIEQKQPSVRLKFYGEKEEKSVVLKIEKQPPANLDPDSLAVYNLFKDEPLSADEICAMSGLPISKVLTALMMLEAGNAVIAIGGNNYQLA